MIDPIRSDLIRSVFDTIYSTGGGWRNQQKEIGMNGIDTVHTVYICNHNKQQATSTSTNSIYSSLINTQTVVLINRNIAYMLQS